jgi:hypothetical protein
MLGRKNFIVKEREFQQWPGGERKNFDKKEKQNND